SWLVGDEGKFSENIPGPHWADFLAMTEYIDRTRFDEVGPIIGFVPFGHNRGSLIKIHGFGHHDEVGYLFLRESLEDIEFLFIWLHRSYF
ncbi:MAG: hypothetical protein ACD_78C00221G0001, partial [uncultured bacterium (gcode 4)]